MNTQIASSRFYCHPNQRRYFVALSGQTIEEAAFSLAVAGIEDEVEITHAASIAFRRSVVASVDAGMAPFFAFNKARALLASYCIDSKHLDGEQGQ